MIFDGIGFLFNSCVFYPLPNARDRKHTTYWIKIICTLYHQKSWEILHIYLLLFYLWTTVSVSFWHKQVSWRNVSIFASNLHDGWTPSSKRRNLFTSYSPFSTLSYFCKSNVVPICSEKIEVYNSSLGFWVLEVPIGVYLCYINPTAVPQVSKFMIKIFSNVKCVSWNSFHATCVKKTKN